MPITDHSRPFPLLGTNIALSDTAKQDWEEQLIARQEKYFQTLKSAKLHPHVEFTLLKISGTPRIQYVCSTHPPNETRKLATFFESKINEMISWIIDPMGETTIQPDLIHSKECLGIPDYITYRSALYTAYKRMALDNDPHSPRVSLTHSTEHATTEEMNIGKSQIDAQWLFYDAQNRLSPNQFSTALAIRLNILSPSLFRAQIKCNCGETIQTSSDMIAHTLKCDQMSPVTHHKTQHGSRRDCTNHQTIWYYDVLRAKMLYISERCSSTTRHHGTH